MDLSFKKSVPAVSTVKKQQYDNFMSDYLDKEITSGWEASASYNFDYLAHSEGLDFMETLEVVYEITSARGAAN